MRTYSRNWLAALLVALALAVAACAGDETATDVDVDDTDAVTDPTDAATDMATDMETTDAATDMATDMETTDAATDMATDMETTDAATDGATDAAMGSEPVGPACEELPEGDEEGGLSAMSTQPAGTAASTNPLLTTLVEAVTAAGLVDTLNSEGPFTIFAPVNEAFDAIPADAMGQVMADTELLTSILTLHVHQGEGLTADALAEMDSLATVNGEEITLEASGDTLMVNGQAEVICANIMVDNGVVHLIDAVMMPGEAANGATDGASPSPTATETDS